MQVRDTDGCTYNLNDMCAWEVRKLTRILRSSRALHCNSLAYNASMAKIIDDNLDIIDDFNRRKMLRLPLTS